MKNAGAGNRARSRVTRRTESARIKNIEGEMKEEITLKLDQPLLGLFEFCETYCVSECCGADAFEITEERISEWVLKNGMAAAEQAEEQIRCIILAIGPRDANVVSKRINFYWPTQACVAWLERWKAILNILISKAK